MTVHKKDVAYIAKLARLSLSSQEQETYTVQLNSIISYVDKLNDLDTTDVSPIAYTGPVARALRNDAPDVSLSTESLQKNGPKIQKKHFSIPRVI